MEGASGLIDAAQLYFLAFIFERDFDSLLDLPLRDLVAKLFHEQAHNVVALSVDDKRRQVVKRRLLQVADHKSTTVHSAGLWHTVSWGNSQRRAHS